MQAYKSYVKMIVTRTNTKTNIKYSEDPTIFALELANEPHTTDDYEIKRGIAPGDNHQGVDQGHGRLHPHARHQPHGELHPEVAQHALDPW